jgi:O-antigen/teichoic acid export membrane protein
MAGVHGRLAQARLDWRLTRPVSRALAAAAGPDPDRDWDRRRDPDRDWDRSPGLDPDQDWDRSPRRRRRRDPGRDRDRGRPIPVPRSVPAKDGGGAPAKSGAGAPAKDGGAAPAKSGATGPAKSGGGNKKLAEIARGSSLNLMGAAVAAVAILGVTVLVTRVFSTPVAGAFFSATSLFLIVESVASLGAYTGAVYFIARLRLLGQEGLINAILRAAIIPVVVASVTGAAALLIFAGPIASVLSGGRLESGGASPSAVATALRALAITLPFAAMLDTLLGASRGYRDMRPSVVIDKLARSVAQLAGVAIAVAAGSAALLAPLWAVPYIPAAAAAWIWLRRVRRSRPSLHAIPPEVAALLALATPVRADGTKLGPGESNADERLADANPRGFWRFTTPRAIATLAQITIQRIDIVLVAIIRGPRDAAIYTAATRFLVAGQFGNAAISQAAQPRFTELFAVGNRREANLVYQATTAWLVLLTWPLYSLALVYGPQFLSIFGRSYNAGVTVMVILAITQLVAAACGQVDMVLITTGRSSWSLANGLLAMVVNVSIDLLLIPRYGITGAAIGWAAAIGAANLMPLLQLAFSSFRLHPFGRDSLLACALCGVSFLAVPLGLRYLLGNGVVSIAAGVAAGTLLLACGLWRFREPLQLSVMPGLSYFMRRSKARSAETHSP